MIFSRIALIVSMAAIGSACSVRDETGSAGQTREQHSSREMERDQSTSSGKVYECTPSSNGQHSDKVCREIAELFKEQLEREKGFQIACDSIGSLDHRVVVRDGDGVVARLDGLDRASARRLASDIYGMFPDCTATVVRQARPI